VTRFWFSDLTVRYLFSGVGLKKRVIFSQQAVKSRIVRFILLISISHAATTTSGEEESFSERKHSGQQQRKRLRQTIDSSP
jgi:hypothetical protein